MYGWQKTYEVFNLLIFGVGIAPGTYRCALLLFIRGLWAIPHKFLIDPEFDGYWAKVLDAPPAPAE